MRRLRNWLVQLMRTRATAERWAQRAGICYRYDGRGGIWTTLDAINAALGVRRESESETYSVDKVL